MVAIRTGADPVAAMWFLGWLSLAAVAAVVAVFLGNWVVPGRPLLAALGATGLSLHPVLICWAASGMESCLYAVLVLLSLMITLSSDGRSWGAAAGVVLALAAMTRPEAVALGPVLVVVMMMRQRPLGEIVTVLAGFALVYGVYFLTRWNHFGYFLPNTFYAKLDYGSYSLWQRGTYYVWDFVRSSPVIVLLAFLAAVIPRAPVWVRAVALTAGVQLLLVVWEGGDHFAMFRFLVPVIPLLGVLCLYMAVRITTLRPAVLPQGSWTVV